jgi:hypothetical protein
MSWRTDDKAWPFSQASLCHTDIVWFRRMAQAVQLSPAQSNGDGLGLAMPSKDARKGVSCLETTMGVAPADQGDGRRSGDGEAQGCCDWPRRAGPFGGGHGGFRRQGSLQCENGTANMVFLFWRERASDLSAGWVGRPGQRGRPRVSEANRGVSGYTKQRALGVTNRFSSVSLRLGMMTSRGDRPTLNPATFPAMEQHGEMKCPEHEGTVCPMGCTVSPSNSCLVVRRGLRSPLGFG